MKTFIFVVMAGGELPAGKIVLIEELAEDPESFQGSSVRITG